MKIKMQKRKHTPAQNLADWVKNPTARAPLAVTSLGAASIKLSADAGKAKDQLLRFLSDLPKEVREAAVDAPADGLGDTVTKFRISNKRVDSYDSTIAPEGWELADFRANPIVLFAHDSNDLPVGRDIGVHVRQGDDAALIGVTRFVSAELDAFGARVGNFVRAGILRATSVGFEPLEWEISDRDDGESWIPAIDFTKTRLREYSIVPVPANADCLVDEERLASFGIQRRDVDSLIESAFEGRIALASRADLEAVHARRKRSLTIDLGALGKFSLRAEGDVQDEATKAEDPAMPEAEAGDGMCPECGFEAKLEMFVKPMASAEGEPVQEDEVTKSLSDDQLIAELKRRGLETKPGSLDNDEEELTEEEARAVAEQLADEEDFDELGRLPE